MYMCVTYDFLIFDSYVPLSDITTVYHSRVLQLNPQHAYIYVCIYKYIHIPTNVYMYVDR